VSKPFRWSDNPHCAQQLRIAPTEWEEIGGRDLVPSDVTQCVTALPSFYMNVICRSLTFNSSAPELKTLGTATPGADACKFGPQLCPASKGRRLRLFAPPKVHHPTVIPNLRGLLETEGSPLIELGDVPTPP